MRIKTIEFQAIVKSIKPDKLAVSYGTEQSQIEEVFIIDQGIYNFYQRNL